MRPLLRLLLCLLAAAAVLPVAALLFAVSDEAGVPLDWKLSQADRARAQALLRQGAKTRPYSLGTLELARPDLELAANYLLNLHRKGAVAVSLKPNQAKFTATLSLPANPLGRYLNLTLAVGNVGGRPLPQVTKFKAGALLLPPQLANLGLAYLSRHPAIRQTAALATRPVQQVLIGADAVTVRYYSDLEALVKAKHLLSQNADPQALAAYRQRIAELIGHHDRQWRLSLATLLKGVFALAGQRSTPATAIQENRAALLAVNEYVNASARPPQPTPPGHGHLPVYLYKRYDLAQHFIASASLAAALDGQVASALGEGKEISDSQPGGSGFSFADLAADRAGTRLGEAAVASQHSALALQRALAGLGDYRDIMPDPAGLPETMDAAAFKNRYQSTQSDAYQRLLDQIDQKIAALAIYGGR